MARWNTNLFPPNGFEFIDSDKIRHVGGSLEDLISKLAAYRTRRGLPPGSPITEVNAYLCNLYPSRCLNGTPPVSTSVVPQSIGSASTRLTSWLRAVWLRVAQKSVEYVGEEESKRRAMICLVCPLHVGLPTECVACSETANTISFQLRAGRDRFSLVLRMCGRSCSDLRVDALLVQPPDSGAPEKCWKRGV